ncbi:hypothetical protein BDP55DRAFT_628587 [Colletotrichum godetiae]|uniref:Uncharacterized protein n=1 Tax=Colletotrichum godetiae TaxID=1209918 RepID=A0AAJ0ATH0_9PEZI|nr:uncharacterized protein BDP55DRAFT_628587 [Colletotrichum godetiae]KAK1690063.1 hypothetical protein BDP55DRAFT_628587 [Colletotrichum godetiae]
MACPDVRQTLIQQLKGQDLHILDLGLLFKQWPKDVSPCLEGLRTLTAERIASFTELTRSRKLMSKIDVGLFISTWYSKVNLERGDILSCVVLWLFTWDDYSDDYHEVPGNEIIAFFKVIGDAVCEAYEHSKSQSKPPSARVFHTKKSVSLANLSIDQTIDRFFSMKLVAS